MYRLFETLDSSALRSGCRRGALVKADSSGGQVDLMPMRWFLALVASRPPFLLHVRCDEAAKLSTILVEHPAIAQIKAQTVSALICRKAASKKAM